MDANGVWYGLMGNGDSEKLKSKPPAFRAAIVGAGERGRCYAQALGNTNGVVSVVVDPVAQRRTSIGDSWIWRGREPKPEEEFNTWQDFVAYEQTRRHREQGGDEVEPGIDAVFICVQDSQHADAVRALAPLNLHLFCEKPLAPTLDDCLDMYSSLLKHGKDRVFGIGHVLRYSPHNKTLRKLVLGDRCIGDILSVEHTEPVGHWHFAHSYVRGNWRKEATSAPSLLAKSCHDIDFLLWLLCSPADSTSQESPHLPALISSNGHLGFFKRSRKPKAAGNATNCLSCPIERNCSYSAKRIYTELEFHPGKAHNWPWPISVLSPDVEDLYVKQGPSAAKDLLLKELARDYDQTQTSPHELAQGSWYGRCVWEADNDVCDDQTVTIVWDESSSEQQPQRPAKTATMHMIAHTQDQCIRRGRIYGSEGEISYNSTTINIFRFDTGQTETVSVKLRGGGHGDGDDGLTEQFAAAVEACKAGTMTADHAQRTHIGCSLDEIIRSHAVVFAAEQARLERRIVDWPTWWQREVEAKMLHLP